MAVTTEQSRVYSHADGLEHYAFDDLQEIGKGFVPVRAQELDHVTTAAALRICFVDTSVERAIRVGDYLRYYGHSIVEHQSIDDIFDALVSENFDLLLLGSVGSARVPLIRSVKELVASYDKDIRVAVISSNEAINRELIAAGADDVFDADTTSPVLNATLTATFEGEQLLDSQTEQTNIALGNQSYSARTVTDADAPPESPIVQERGEVRASEQNAAASENILEELHKHVQEQRAHLQTLHFPSPTQEAPVSFSSLENQTAKADVPTVLPRLESHASKPDAPAKEELPQVPRAEKPKTRRDEKSDTPPTPRPDPVFVAVEKARKGDIDVPPPTSQLQDLVWMLGVIPVKLPVLLALAWVVVKFVVPKSQGM